MKTKLDYKKIIKKIILCILTGALTVCAFPKLNLFFLAWVAFVPMIFAVMKTGFKSSFFYCFLSGLIFNVLGLYWFVTMLYFNVGSYLQVIISSGALWIYLALYWGVWGLCLNFLASKNIVKSVLGSNILIAFFASCVWVLLEYIRTYALTGCPLLLIGYSQVEFTGIVQIAEFTGVYGVSFLVVFCNLCFYFWISAKKESLKQRASLYLCAALVVIGGFSIFGVIRVDKFRFFSDKEFTVAAVQPNIEQYKKMDLCYKDNILSTLKEYALEISKIKADLVVWPETVLPDSVCEGKESLCESAKTLSDTAGGFNILSSIYKDKNNKSFNAVLAFENGDYKKAVHKKNHLVVFGEFVPFRTLLSKIFGVLNEIGDLTKGEDAEVFSNGQLRIGATICSENLFPDTSRKFALSGAKVLTNHTNDAWFFDTAAPYQHFIMNVFRAIENRKTIIVSANSGISGIIDASGIVVKKTLSSKGVLVTGKFLQNDFKTFYTKYGDLFVGLCVATLLGLALLRLRDKIRKSPMT